MTAQNPEPELELEQPGYGRYWLVGKVGKTARWGAGLYSREDVLLGYVAQYETGWGASILTRRKTPRSRYKPIGALGYATAQEAAAALLRKEPLR